VAGALVAGTVAVVDLRTAIGFSGLGVLVSYAIANAAAWTLGAPRPAGTRPLAAAGLAGCLALAASLPVGSVLAGVGILAGGLAARALLRRGRPRAGRGHPGVETG